MLPIGSVGIGIVLALLLPLNNDQGPPKLELATL
jgi:hypothetical protein